MFEVDVKNVMAEKEEWRRNTAQVCGSDSQSIHQLDINFLQFKSVTVISVLGSTGRRHKD